MHRIYLFVAIPTAVVHSCSVASVHLKDPEGGKPTTPRRPTASTERKNESSVFKTQCKLSFPAGAISTVCGAHLEIKRTHTGEVLASRDRQRTLAMKRRQQT